MTPPLDISQNKSLLWLMAIACGLCAGANYYCQPLISSIQQYYQVPESQVALTVTFAQVSYALGLLFIVPLGDMLNKSRLIPFLMFGAALGLLICATAVNLPMLWVGTIIAGLLSDLFHWKTIYALSSMALLVLGFYLKGQLPSMPRMRISYAAIFKSMGMLLREEPRLGLRSLIGACAFAAMSMLFSTIALLLTQKPFYLSDVMVGLVTLVGVFGALSTQVIGKWADRGYIKILTWIGCSILAGSWLFLYFGGVSLLSYILGYALINLGLAITHSCNQNVIFRLRPDAKSRLNSIYMTLYFIGGACGSALGVYAWHHGGWSMTCLFGLGLALCATLFALIDQWQQHRAKA